MSIFKKMKHDAINDDETDDARDGNDNHMKIQELDGAFCENVPEIRGMTLPKPRFRNSADQVGLVGRNGKCPLVARTNVLEQLIKPSLHLHHRQRGRQTRRYPLRASKMKVFRKLLLRLQNQ